jgi:SAM-dependent methyltransferase
MIMGIAHALLDGKTGIELGAAAHNSFGLAGSINVAPGDDDPTVYRPSQIAMCGFYCEIDIEAEAHDLPVDDDSQDYVISSHVFEHLPDPMAALREMIRVIRDGGTLFMIVPLPGALDEDKGRPLATIKEWWDAQGVTVDTWEYATNPVPGGRRGHYFVYDAPTLGVLIEHYFGEVRQDSPRLTLIAREDVDTKAGNGFTLVYRVSKPQPAPESRTITREQFYGVDTLKNTDGSEADIPAGDLAADIAKGGDPILMRVSGESELFVPDLLSKEMSAEDTHAVFEATRDFPPAPQAAHPDDQAVFDAAPKNVRTPGKPKGGSKKWTLLGLLQVRVSP